ncbi:MAG: hypothetical protein M3209_06360 [Acidobacteriota bacterium]|nr:hypothetical protein [Acidobacteriota bacterium]
MSNFNKLSGYSAIFGGIAGCLLVPLLSLGYYSSYAMPSETSPFWISTVRPFLSALLDFADAIEVYTFYGRIFPIVYLLVLPGVFALHRLQAKNKSGFEKFSFVFLVFALTVSFFGVTFDYWGIKIGWTIELLGMLLLQISATIYGAASLRLKIIPRIISVLLMLSIPLCVISFLIFKQIPGAPTLPFAVASIAIGAFILAKSESGIDIRLQKSLKQNLD